MELSATMQSLEDNISGAVQSEEHISGTLQSKEKLVGNVAAGTVIIHTEHVTVTAEETEDGVVLTVIDKTGTSTALIKNGINGSAGTSGKDGYTPVKGIDYFDGKDGKDGVDGKDGYTPIKGVDYFDGKDGYTPVKGVDYSDGKDGNDGYTPVKGVDYFDGKDGQDGKDGYTPQKGIDYFDGAKGDPGDPGKPGVPGDPGKSAYQYAKDGGYTGTEAEFTAKLAQDYASVEYVNGLFGDYITDVSNLVGGDA